MSTSSPPTPHPTLTPSDAQTLSLILNQPPTPAIAPALIDSTFPTPFPHLQARERTILAPLNVPHPSEAALHSASAKLTTLIQASPTYASAYNNRAQVTRLLYGSDLTSPALASSTIWDDLDAAIHYASPPEAAVVDPFTAKVLGAAYTQRGGLVLGIVVRSRSRSQHNQTKNEHQDQDQEERKCQERLLPAELRLKSREMLEGMANWDFEMGGRYGSLVGRAMARRTNVWGKACGAVVREAMGREMRGSCLDGGGEGRGGEGRGGMWLEGDGENDG
ncbi:hypothetical protein MMC28_008888 [Mycoblastus sanguinarius]|nr:hypothetical protein [Mycoblastus sanguinarius]